MVRITDAIILWVEGRRAGSSPFIFGLRKKGYQVEIVYTGKEALSRLPDVSPDLVVLNASTMRSPGTRICQSLRDSADGVPVLLISEQESIKSKDICADVVLCLPFTTRKLENRIKPFLPGESDDVISAGPIRLDIERKQVRCMGEKSTLTPRLMHLLRMFMEQPGEALEREQLFREVWNTEYTGDTRTLDVHISWLRRAIEKDPRNPQFLKTIRGVGYRLDV